MHCHTLAASFENNWLVQRITRATSPYYHWGTSALSAVDNRYHVTATAHQWLSRASAFDRRYHITTRALGVVQVIGGVLETVGGGALTVTSGVAEAPTLGTSTVGVVAGGATMGFGLDNLQAGARTVWNGTPATTAGGALISHVTGISTQHAELAYAGVQLVTGVGAGIAISRLGPAAESSGVTFEGTLYRAVPEGGNPLDISYSVAANGRYTAPGQGGLYFASNARTVEAEFANNVSSLTRRTLHSFPDSSVDNLLDLTNPATRADLGVSLSDLTRTGGTPAWRYEVTQPFGAFAQRNGYSGIIAPSAQADGGVNLILFGSKGVR